MQLTISAASGLCLLAILLTSCSRATVSTTYRVHSDATAHVASPQVVVGAEGENLKVSGHWAADVVSGATPVMAAPDTLTGATEFRDRRDEVGLFADFQQSSERTLSATYLVSGESDYLSHTVTSSMSGEVLDRHAAWAVGIRLGGDSIGRSDVPDFRESLWTTGVNLAWTHVLGPEWVGHIAYEFERRQGYQANPYRMIPVYEAGASRPTVVLSEQHPLRRTRHALEPVMVWSASERLFLHGSYRIYGDDWGLQSHTFRAEIWRLWWGDVLRTRLQMRTYSQGRADFYRRRYEQVEAHRSGDYRLSEMSSHSAGARLDLRPDLFDHYRFSFSASYDATFYRLSDYSPRQSMLSHSFGLNVRMEWK